MARLKGKVHVVDFAYHDNAISRLNLEINILMRGMLQIQVLPKQRENQNAHVLKCVSMYARVIVEQNKCLHKCQTTGN